MDATRFKIDPRLVMQLKLSLVQGLSRPVVQDFVGAQ
jgi:hypothetical protein